MKYSVVTFGCRVNQADSFAIEDELRAHGARAVDASDADVVIVNTCSVTSSADQGARQVIRRVSRDNPKAEIIVTGCYATRRPGELAALPNVVRVIANDRKDALVRDLHETTAARYGDGDGSCGAALTPGVAGRTALTVRVQTGCDEPCAYCIIPKTRGAGRSVPLPQVLTQIRRAVDAGYKEIAVTGVHLGSYGRDLGDGTVLETLVRRLAGWSAEVLFRISSLEPMDCSDAIVDLIAASPSLAPHFHLPLQHGSDEMLSAMKRPYTAAYYRRLVERIRERIPAAAIGSDLIVGFPGEQASHASASLSLVSSLPLTHLHVFPYSDRPGTAATGLPDHVAGPEVRDRTRDLRAIGHELTRRFQLSQIGRTRRGLTVDDGSHVVTDNYLKMPIPAGRSRNEWVHVVIGGTPGALTGAFADARSL